VADGEAFLRDGHQITRLTEFGIGQRAAAELTVQLRDRPTRAQVLLWIEQAENRVYRRFIALWLASSVVLVGSLAAVLWRVFGG